jgi:hypothetical protein
MTTLNDKLTQLAKAMANEDESACAQSFEKFCQENFQELPLPGENKLFDQAMWNASQFAPLSKGDQAIVKKVTGNMLEAINPVSVGVANAVATAAAASEKSVFVLRELVGQARDSAASLWQDMLSAQQWQQMVPAGATRGVGAQLVSLGTFERTVDDVRIQVNLGWLIDDNNLRVLLQAKDNEDNAIPQVEVRITENERGVVFSRMTNQDGAMVAPAVKVGPGQYQIQVFWSDKVVETPFFRI